MRFTLRRAARRGLSVPCYSFWFRTVQKSTWTSAWCTERSALHRTTACGGPFTSVFWVRDASVGPQRLKQSVGVWSAHAQGPERSAQMTNGGLFLRFWRDPHPLRRPVIKALQGRERPALPLLQIIWRCLRTTWTDELLMTFYIKGIYAAVCEYRVSLSENLQLPQLCGCMSLLTSFVLFWVRCLHMHMHFGGYRSVECCGLKCLFFLSLSFFFLPNVNTCSRSIWCLHNYCVNGTPFTKLLPVTTYYKKHQHPRSHTRDNQFEGWMELIL